MNYNTFIESIAALCDQQTKIAPYFMHLKQCITVIFKITKKWVSANKEGFEAYVLSVSY